MGGGGGGVGVHCLGYMFIGADHLIGWAWAALIKSRPKNSSPAHMAEQVFFICVSAGYKS